MILSKTAQYGMVVGKLYVANVGDSYAVLCRAGVAVEV